MPEWGYWFNKEVDGVRIDIFERLDRRGPQGASEFFVKCYVDDHLVHHERISRSVWEGHCNGHILFPDIAKRAMTAAEAEISQTCCRQFWASWPKIHKSCEIAALNGTPISLPAIKFCPWCGDPKPSKVYICKEMPEKDIRDRILSVTDNSTNKDEPV